MDFKNTKFQKLNGKWILKEAGHKHFRKSPGLLILVISHNKASVYDNFKLTDAKIHFNIKEGAFFQDNGTKYANFELIDSHSLRLFGSGVLEEDGIVKDVIIEFDYVRILPTKTDLQQAEIEGLSWKVPVKDKSNFVISFDQQLRDNKKLSDSNLSDGLKMSLDKMDSTYFIIGYLNGRKVYTVPIHEISKQILKYSFLPNDPEEVIATSMNEEV